MSAKNTPTQRTIAVNRKARFEYSIEEVFEAGIVLTGTEVKSIRQGNVSIGDAYASHKADEIWLINAYIAEYTSGNRYNHEPKRSRKLLLHRRQIQKLVGRLKTKGVTLIPLSLFFNKRGIVKISIGIALGKKQYEKRDAIKEREWKRQKERLLKRG
jgi:SsrA-binding protein